MAVDRKIEDFEFFANDLPVFPNVINFDEARRRLRLGRFEKVHAPWYQDKIRSNEVANGLGYELLSREIIDQFGYGKLIAVVKDYVRGYRPELGEKHINSKGEEETIFIHTIPLVW